MSQESTEGDTSNPTLTPESLREFTGTFEYHRLTMLRSVVFTDGMHYVAEVGKAFWLMDVIASHLVAIDSKREPFTSGTLTRNKTGGATFLLTDGNDKPLRQQEIEYTDFPLDSLEFFASHDGTQWVVMLRNEY